MTTAAETKVTATELAKNLSDILNRVKYRGERFVVLRNGEAIAVLEPTVDATQRIVTWGEFAAIWPTLQRPDDDFADDLEAVIAAQPLAELPSWDE